MRRPTMHMALRSIVPGALLFVILAAPAIAQTTTESDSDLVKEVAALRKTMEEAVALLDRALVHQRVELLLKRLDLRERRVLPLESELRAARDGLTASRNEVERFELILEETEQRISEEVRDGTDSPDSENRRLQQDLEQALAHVRRSLESDEERVRRLEDDLADRLEEIEFLEDSLQERLDSLE
jgi:hypothetical protein